MARGMAFLALSEGRQCMADARAILGRQAYGLPMEAANALTKPVNTV